MSEKTRIYYAIEVEPGVGDCMIAMSLDKATVLRMVDEFMAESKMRWVHYRPTEDMKDDSGGTIADYACLDKYCTHEKGPDWWVHVFERDLDRD